MGHPSVWGREEENRQRQVLAADPFSGMTERKATATAKAKGEIQGSFAVLRMTVWGRARK
jgi:hypothetical protein